MNILVIGDVVSAKGCEFLRSVLPTFKKVKGIDFCIANGENSAVGNGITPFSAQYLFDSGVDFITTGNHVYRRREFYEILDEREDIIRPANFHKGNPGRGYAVVDMGFTRIAVVNLAGTVYMDNCDNPFTAIDEILPKINDCKIKIVDFHAEATAEKKAMGFYLDGRVSAVFGTHTHVMTGDARILPKGTAYITDVGMCGESGGVLGMSPEGVVKRMRTKLQIPFTPASGKVVANGVIFTLDNATGRVRDVRRISF